MLTESCSVSNCASETERLGSSDHGQSSHAARHIIWTRQKHGCSISGSSSPSGSGRDHLGDVMYESPCPPLSLCKSPGRHCPQRTEGWCLHLKEQPLLVAQDVGKRDKHATLVSSWLPPVTVLQD